MDSVDPLAELGKLEIELFLGFRENPSLVLRKSFFNGHLFVCLCRAQKSANRAHLSASNHYLFCSYRYGTVGTVDKNHFQKVVDLAVGGGQSSSIDIAPYVLIS